MVTKTLEKELFDVAILGSGFAGSISSDRDEQFRARYVVDASACSCWTNPPLGIADYTPALVRPATGADDLNEAFLNLVAVDGMTALSRR